MQPGLAGCLVVRPCRWSGICVALFISFAFSGNRPGASLLHVHVPPCYELTGRSRPMRVNHRLFKNGRAVSVFLPRPYRVVQLTSLSPASSLLDRPVSIAAPHSTAVISAHRFVDRSLSAARPCHRHLSIP